MLFANSTSAQESGARNGRVANLHFVAILRPDVAPPHPFGIEVVKIYANFGKLRAYTALALCPV